MYKTNGIYVTHVYICLFCLSLLFFLFRKMYGIYVHTHIRSNCPAFPGWTRRKKRWQQNTVAKQKRKKEKNAPLRELFSPIDVKTQERGEGSLASSKARSLKI